MGTLRGSRKIVAAIGAGLWLIGRAARGMARRLVAGDRLAQQQLADSLPLHVWRPLRTLLPLAALAGIRFMLYLAGAPDKKRTAID